MRHWGATAAREKVPKFTPSVLCGNPFHSCKSRLESSTEHDNWTIADMADSSCRDHNRTFASTTIVEFANGQFIHYEMRTGDG